MPTIPRLCNRSANKGASFLSDLVLENNVCLLETLPYLSTRQRKPLFPNDIIYVRHLPHTLLTYLVPQSSDHYRSSSHSRHSYDSGGVSNSSSDHERFSSHGPSSVYKSSSSSSKGEFRSRHSHSYHHNYRPSHHYHSSSNSYNYHNDVGDHGYDDEVPVKKRPRLTVDVSRKAPPQYDAPNSADSVISSSNFTTGSATPSIANESPATSPPPVCAYVCYGVCVYVCVCVRASE